MAYVYTHSKKGTKDVFYIGIGSDTEYKRANNLSDRSAFCKNINKKHGTSVSIIVDNISWQDAVKWEIYLIGLYGRRDTGSGILVNLTDGGEGPVGVIVSKESRLKISIKTKQYIEQNREVVLERIKKASQSSRLKDYYISRRGKPSGYKHTEENRLKMSLSKIGKKISKELLDKMSKKIIQKSMDGNVVKIWDSANQVQRETNFSQGNISRCCNGEYKQSYGYKWEYYKQ